MLLSAVALVVMLLVGKYQQEKALSKKSAFMITVKASQVSKGAFVKTIRREAGKGAVMMADDRAAVPGEKPAKTPEEVAGEKPAETSENKEETVLESLADLKAGKKLSEEQLDMKHIGKYFTAQKIRKGDVIYRRINGKSYVKNPYVKLSDLRYLKMLHYNFKGEIRVGEMIVHKSMASDVRSVFTSLFKKKYPIRRMYLVEKYWAGDSTATDAASIKADNTSCFNYRAIIGSTKVSKHAMGLAIDLNPFENPYVPKHNGRWDYSALGKKEKAYARDRTPREYVITTKDAAYRLFSEKGFTWGGSWRSVKDYQHFER